MIGRRRFFAITAVVPLIGLTVKPKKTEAGRKHLLKEHAEEWVATRGREYCINCDTIHDVMDSCATYPK